LALAATVGIAQNDIGPVVTFDSTPSGACLVEGMTTWDASTDQHYECESLVWTLKAGGGAGDVTGPGSSLDNEIVRFHLTTGKVIQAYTSGGPTVSDTGVLTINSTMNALGAGTGVVINATNTPSSRSFDIQMGGTSHLYAEADGDVVIPSGNLKPAATIQLATGNITSTVNDATQAFHFNSTGVSHSGDLASFQDQGANRLRIENDGDVVIAEDVYVGTGLFVGSTWQHSLQAKYGSNQVYFARGDGVTSQMSMIMGGRNQLSWAGEHPDVTLDCDDGDIAITTCKQCVGGIEKCGFKDAVATTDTGIIRVLDANGLRGTKIWSSAAKWFHNFTFRGGSYSYARDITIEARYSNSVDGAGCTISTCNFQTIGTWTDNTDLQRTMVASFPNIASPYTIFEIKWTMTDWSVADGTTDSYFYDVGLYHNNEEAYPHYLPRDDAFDRWPMSDAINWVDDSGTLFGLDLDTANDEFDFDTDINVTGAVKGTSIDLENFTLTIADDELMFGTGAGTGAYGKISTLVEETAPAAGDFLLCEDETGDLQKCDVGDLPAGSEDNDLEDQMLGCLDNEMPICDVTGSIASYVAMLNCDDNTQQLDFNSTGNVFACVDDAIYINAVEVNPRDPNFTNSGGNVTWTYCTAPGVPVGCVATNDVFLTSSGITSEDNALETDDPTDVDDHEVYVGNGLANGVWRTIPDCHTNNSLTYTQGTHLFGCEADDGAGSGDDITVNTSTDVVDPDFIDNLMIKVVGALGPTPDTVEWNFNFDNTLASNPAFAAEVCVPTTDGAGGGGFLCEGTAGGANTNEQLFLWPATDDADTTNFICVDDKQVVDLEGTGLSITAGVLNAAGGSGDVTAVGAGCLTGNCWVNGLATTGTDMWAWEGTTVDAEDIKWTNPADPSFTTEFVVPDPTADRTLTFPQATGTFVVGAFTGCIGSGGGNEWNPPVFNASTGLASCYEPIADGSGTVGDIVWISRDGSDAFKSTEQMEWDGDGLSLQNTGLDTTLNFSVGAADGLIEFDGVGTGDSLTIDNVGGTIDFFGCDAPESCAGSDNLATFNMPVDVGTTGTPQDLVVHGNFECGGGGGCTAPFQSTGATTGLDLDLVDAGHTGDYIEIADNGTAIVTVNSDEDFQLADSTRFFQANGLDEATYNTTWGNMVLVETVAGTPTFTGAVNLRAQNKVSVSTGGGASIFRSLWVTGDFQPTGNDVTGQIVTGAYYEANDGSTGTGHSVSLIGQNNLVQTVAAGTTAIPDMEGARYKLGFTGTNTTITDAKALAVLQPSAPGSGTTVANLYGLYIEDQLGYGATNSSAIGIATQSGGADATENNVDMQGGNWNTGHIMLGNAHLWFDGTTLYGNVTTPTGATDGTSLLGGGFIDIDTDYGDETVTSTWTINDQGTGALTAYDLTVGDSTDYGILRIGDAVIGRTNNTTGYNLDGAVIFQNSTGPVTGDIEFGFLDSANLLRFGLPKSAVGNATYNPRCFLNAGPAIADSDIVTVSYWQGTGIFGNLTCDTGTDGADMGVQNSLEVEDTIFVDVIAESTAAAGVTIDGMLVKDAHITEGDISDLSHFTTGDEVNNLGVAVTWANVPDANVDGGNERDEVLVAAAGGTDLTCAAGVCNVDSPVTSATTATTATTANNLAADALDATTEIDGTLCGTGEILEDQGASWACITTPAGGSETNTLTTVMTGVTSGQVPIGTTAGGVAAYVTWPACDADEAPEFLDGAPDTIVCEQISGLVDADVSNTLTASLFVGSGSTSNAIDLATAEVDGVLPAANVDTAIARLASPTLTGNPLSATPSQGDSDTSIATTDFVDRRFQQECKTIEDLVAADDDVLMFVPRVNVTIEAVACQSSAAATVVLEDYGGTAIETIVCETDGAIAWDSTISGTATLIAGEVMRMDTTSESTPTWTMVCFAWSND